MPHFIKAPRTTPRRKSRQPEHEMQVALFKWAALAGNQDARLRLLFAVPNGGHRDARTAAKLKAEGVKAGVPDVFLPVPCGRIGGLWLELKAGKNKPTAEQRAWHTALRSQGYAVEVVVDDWQRAVTVIERYLSVARIDVPAKGMPSSAK